MRKDPNNALYFQAQEMLESTNVYTDIKTTKQFYEFDRETNAEKAQKLGEIEELRLLFEDIFFVPPTVLENLPFRGAVPCGTRKFSPPD